MSVIDVSAFAKDEQLKGWEDLNKLTAVQLLCLCDEIINLPRETFIDRIVRATKFEDRGKSLNKLKSDILNLLIKKVNGQGTSSLTLANPTSLTKIAHDIHTLCLCYSAGRLDAVFLTMSFNKSISDTTNDINNQILEEMQILSRKFNEGLSKITETNDDNNTITDKLADMVDSNVNFSRKKSKKFNFLGSKKVSQEENLEFISKLTLAKNVPPEQIHDNNLTPVVTTKVPNEQNNVQVSDADKSKEVSKPKYALMVQKTNSKNNNNTSEKSDSRKSVPNSLVNSKDNSKFKQVEINGQSHIVVDNNSEGFTMSHGGKRYNKKRNGVVIGTALSEVRQLRAVSRPYTYHTGQWSMDTNPDWIRKYASNFAQVIDVIEINTHIKRPYFRTFKLIAESYCDNAIMREGKWPMGVVVKRWFPQKNKPSNTKANVPITKGTALLDKISSPSAKISSPTRNLQLGPSLFYNFDRPVSKKSINYDNGDFYAMSKKTNPFGLNTTVMFGEKKANQKNDYFVIENKFGQMVREFYAKQSKISNSENGNDGILESNNNTKPAISDQAMEEEVITSEMLNAKQAESTVVDGEKELEGMNTQTLSDSATNY